MMETMKTYTSADGTTIAFWPSGSAWPLGTIADHGRRIVVMPGRQHIALDTNPDLSVAEALKFLLE